MQPSLSHASNDPKRGILLMLVTIFFFVCMDTVAKYSTTLYPVEQVIWGRYLFHMLVVLLLFNRRVPALLKTSRPGMQVGRSLLLVLTTVCFFFGLSQIPLIEASSIMLISPLLVTALSVPLLGEKVGLRRWISILIGCGGALLIIRPGSAVFQLASLLPLTAAVLFSFYQITTRALSFTDSPLTTLIYTALVGAVATSIAVPFFWQWPDLLGWSLMIVTGCLGGIGQFCFIKAFQAAPASTVTPFTYSNVIWATSLGYLVFGHLPDSYTVAGAAILITSGLYVFHREQIKKSQA